MREVGNMQSFACELLPGEGARGYWTDEPYSQNTGGSSLSGPQKLTPMDVMLCTVMHCAHEVCARPSTRP